MTHIWAPTPHARPSFCRDDPSPHLSSETPCLDPFLYRCPSSTCLGCNSLFRATFLLKHPLLAAYALPFCAELYRCPLYSICHLTPSTWAPFNMLRIWKPTPGHLHTQMLSLPCMVSNSRAHSCLYESTSGSSTSCQATFTGVCPAHPAWAPTSLLLGSETTHQAALP